MMIKHLELCKEAAKDKDKILYTRQDYINGTITKEQIRDKIIQAHQYNYPSNFWRSINNCNLLGIIAPSMLDTVTQYGGMYHAEFVFDHLMYTLDAISTLEQYKDNYLIKLACVLHDIGKPSVAKIGKDNQIHFHKHEIEGASIVYNWMTDLRFNKQDIRYVVSKVRNHQWRFDSNSTNRTIRRWLQKVGPTWKDLIWIRWADRKGNMAKQDKSAFTSHMTLLTNKAEAIINEGKPIFKEDLVISYKDLEDTNIDNQDKLFADILGIVYNDPIKNNRDWLLNFIKIYYGKKDE